MKVLHFIVLLIKVILPRLDAEWLEGQEIHRLNLMWVLDPNIAEGDIIAIQSVPIEE